METSLNKIPGAVPAVLAVIFMLAGCAGTGGDERGPDDLYGGTTGTGTGAGTGPGATTSILPGRGGYSAADLNDPTSPLYQRVIYFDYDSSDIRPQFVDVLRAHASYLASNAAAAVVLDGHTDERGTREYNLALGEQRADTVHDFLIAEGVPNGRVRAMSYGEERPAKPGHDESSWALNRRVELAY